MDSIQQPTEHVSMTEPSMPESSRKTKGRVDGIVIWAVLSVGTLAWIALGSVDARVWRFSRLRIESISVLDIWEYQTRSLPRVAHQWILESVFMLALIVFIAGVIAAAWLLLVASLDQPEESGDGAQTVTSTTEI